MAAPNSTVCDGWRSREGGIPRRPPDCKTWKPADDLWSISEAMIFAAFVGLKMSKPTVIKLCKRTGTCRRRMHSTRYIVNAERFRQVLLDELRED